MTRCDVCGEEIGEKNVMKHVEVKVCQEGAGLHDPTFNSYGKSPLHYHFRCFIILDDQLIGKEVSDE